MTWNPSPDDIWRFTEGDCHVLARAVARLSGLACASFAWSGIPDFHAFNVLPDGRCLDVLGLFDEDAFRRKWGATDYDLMIHPSPRACAAEWGSPRFGRYSWPRARIIAGRLLTSFPEAGRLIP